MSLGANEAALTVGEAGEHRVIALVRDALPPAPDWVVIGIGDDAAVIERSRNQLDVLTTDALVEGVHFDRRFVDPGSIGFRALAVNLSDLAAMGAAPRVALLSLGLPASLTLADLDAMIGGLVELATRQHVTLVGGNVTRSPGPLFLDVTLTGTAKRRKVLTRAGGRAGDELFVTGTLGAAAAGLAWLRLHGLPANAADIPEIVQGAVLRYLRPEPRMRFGLIAGRTRAASACMDLSDGLADAVRQLAAASRTGARVDLDHVPIDPAARRLFGHVADGPAQAALGAGDDYELLCAVPRRAGRRFAAAARTAGLAVTRIGALTPDADLVLHHDGRDHAWPAGFEHFSA